MNWSTWLYQLGPDDCISSRRRYLTVLICTALCIAILACGLSPRVKIDIGSGLERMTVRVLVADPAISLSLYAGANGVFKSTDGGKTWAAIGLTDIPIYDLEINPENPTVIYAGTEQGMFKTTNGGEDWIALKTELTGTSVQIIEIDPISSFTIYAGTGSNEIVKSTDSGETWNLANAGLAGTYIRDLVIDPVNPSTLYVGTYGNGVFKSVNGGQDWKAANAGLSEPHIRVLAIDHTRPDTLYAAGSGVFKSTDGGKNWQATGLTLAAITDLEIDSADPDKLYASTWGGQVRRSIDGGCKWSTMNIHLPEDVINDLLINWEFPNTLYIAMVRNGVFVAEVP